MNLSARTLLFSLMVTYAVSAMSMYVAVSSRKEGGTLDGMGKWAAAMLMDSLAWALIAMRGTISDLLSVVVANVLIAGAFALMLAAVYEYQQRQAERWQYFVPVGLVLLMALFCLHDTHARFLWGGLIYGIQMLFIARALLSHQTTRAGRAWRLLFGGTLSIILVLGLRGAFALSSNIEFAEPQNAMTLQPVQIITYIAAISIALLGSFGFILLAKERTDREIMHLAMTDSLTRVPNRRALMEYAEHSLARRSKLPLALLIIDLDHFKQVNDTHGHLVGDEVLQQIANLLEGRLRGHDLLGRYGGEEFCVIAPETDNIGALTLAESLREIVAGTPISTDVGELNITVSIGISCCPPTAKRQLKEVLQEADTSLYAAKQTGRNKVVCFDNNKELSNE